MLSPLDLGFTQIRNRVVMGSIHSGLEETKDDPTKHMTAFFRERAKGGVGLIVTGGVAPNFEGKVYPMAAKLTTTSEAHHWKPVTSAVHEEGGKILMQVLHAGRYSYSPIAVAPSAIRSPISMFPFPPLKLPDFWIRKTIRDFANCAALAREAGFDGIEIMGSEGYLINQFICQHTNKRSDQWGGSYENRIRLPLEIIKAVRETVGPDFILMYRLSMLDFVPNGSSKEEVYQLAEAVSHAGVNIINTGIGWHEARVPTIATSVPRASFTWVTKKCREHLRSKGIQVPLVTSNRINTPAVAEDVLSRGDADMVSMARPLLADAHFVKKAQEGRADEINVCIGCNQACLDHTFKMKVASCLLNPVACHELKRTPKHVSETGSTPKKIAVIGAGPSGVSCALTLAERGHTVTLFDSHSTVGGQFNLAKTIPGKSEFQSSIDYWTTTVKRQPNITLRLGSKVSPQDVASTELFDEVVVATGCGPKKPSPSVMEGVTPENPNVLSYYDVLTGAKKPGRRVAIIGGGGIGFDMAVYLTHAQQPDDPTAAFSQFASEWGIDTTLTHRGSLLPKKEVAPTAASAHDVTMFQRKASKMGKNLGTTTGWIHRLGLKKHHVGQHVGANYKSFVNGVLTVEVEGKTKTFEIDTLLLCHGQAAHDQLAKEVKKLRPADTVHLIGGCSDPSELDAKKAILQGHELALTL
jgi:2,4-dienoyl-CoA reductase (NADPH2)